VRQSPASCARAFRAHADAASVAITPAAPIRFAST
jgi:hypothetical protein